MLTSGLVLAGDRAEAAPLKLGAWAISAAADDSLTVEVAGRGGGGGGGGGARRAAMNRGGAGINRAGFNRAGFDRGGFERGGFDRGGINRAADFNRTDFNRTNINRDVNVNRGAFAQGAGRWRRPANYWWPVGGAIAAGAAIGYVGANAAYSYAGSPPGSGYCWFYTDQSQTQGFWDVCPQQ
jgi:hypothetical protein